MQITVTNTMFGQVPQVNANSMLVVVGATAANAGAGNVSFSLNTPAMIRSLDELESMGVTEENNAELYKQVSDFYAPVGGVNNTGTVLWVVGVAAAGDASVATSLADWVRATVTNGFQYRPRNIMVSYTPTYPTVSTPTELQKVVDLLYTEGFSTVVVMSGKTLTTDITTVPEDLSTKNAGMVGVVIVTNVEGGRPCVGLVGGYLASLSVGTSIGDVSLPSVGDTFYFCDKSNTLCASISLNLANQLGENQYIFARTRPPKNGLWFNDGATANDPNTALSTLEAARTIASLVDDLRAFFTPYINTKVPCDASGNIQSSYKQMVLSAARSQVISPYIASGDISDASIDLKALNDDMIGTRTWEVSLAIMPAPTLRWIDGYVFYVKNL